MKNTVDTAKQEAHENLMIRKDFTFVVVLNVVLLGLMIALYFWNRSTGAVDGFFGQLIKF